jgi:hypothetical protein
LHSKSCFLFKLATRNELAFAVILTTTSFHRFKVLADIVAVLRAHFGDIVVQEDVEAGDFTLEDLYADIEADIDPAPYGTILESRQLLSSARSQSAAVTAPSSLYVRVLMALISLVMALAMAVSVGRQWGLQQSMGTC